MDIREYLCREAAAVSDASLRSIGSADDWLKERPRRFARYLDSLGLCPHLEAPRTPLNVQVTGVVQRSGYRLEKVCFEALPRLYVTANLYVPDDLDGPAPGVGLFCGHAAHQKEQYQPHARRFARLGFVVLLVETIELGEIRGDHHGVFRQGQFHLYSRGYTPAGVECWNGIRALDLLCERPEVDAERIGVTGNSGGGATTWWLAAADERVKVAAPSCSTGTMRSHLAERTVDGHCDCMYHINTDLWDQADIGALIAPRPLLVAAADRDSIYKIDSVRETVGKLQRLYDMLGAGDNIRLVEVPGPHGYRPASRTAIFSWFLKHLAGRDVPPEEVGDVNEAENETPEVLRVYVDGIPADERTSTIRDDFVPLAKPKACTSRDELEARRREVVARLRELSFNHFPDDAPLDLDVHQHMEEATAVGVQFRFTGEEGWRLPGHIWWSKELSRPCGVLLGLRSPREPRGETGWLAAEAGKSLAVAAVQTRGTGYLSWGDEMNWHVRRGAAIIGRTVASMRVYDTLRALQAVRSLDGVDGEQVSLVARGEMVPVALYAALLDGNVRAVVMQDAPATQDCPSRPDGTDNTIEMLSCLRITDLPEVAGLLWPAELVFVGVRPETYALAEETYRHLGLPGAVRHLKSLDAWCPAPIG